MKKDLINEIIKRYIEKSTHKNFQINQVRKELEARDIPEAEIRAIVKSVDYEVQKNAVAKSTLNGGNELVLVGVISIVIGVGVLAYFLIWGGGLIWIFIFLITGGISLVMAGLAKKKKIGKNKK